MITLSEDSYVRLTISSLKDTDLTHLVSGLDDDEPYIVEQGTVVSDISGYTEWVSRTIPAVSIGWDWRMAVKSGSLLCVRVGQPRSNLMLVDYNKCDLGTIKTLTLLEQAIDEMVWQEETLNAINKRYK